MEDGGGNKLERPKIPDFLAIATHEAKLKELLRSITSIELKLCSDASKEFVKLLRGGDGGELLREYVRTSSGFSELLQAWKIRQGKSGLSYVLSLVFAFLSHPDGKYKPNDTDGIGISRALDKFARSIIEEKMDDIYKELNSKELKRQNAALLVLAAIVRRGSVLASDVARCFDFKVQIFSKLAEYKQKQSVIKRKQSNRRAFVAFAMSFIEVGRPGLLRWVLQQREIYSGVLRGLGNDDDETIIYILSTLRDRVLTPESLVPSGLRSVLFGGITLDQLISISGRDDGGLAAELAHAVLVMVCIDPSNGLMPDLEKYPNPLRGNPKRLLALMKKLKATEIDCHRDLLLAIMIGRPLFGSAYLDEFPYNLEDYASSSWFAAVSLAANVISLMGTGRPFGFLDSQHQEPPSFSSLEVQSIVRCMAPCSFSRLVINKGLLHSDSLVKHGTLRLVLEEFKLLDSFILALDNRCSSANQVMYKWVSLKQEILNEVRVLLPDPQVLLSLLSSLNRRYRSCDSCFKRAADSEIVLEHKNRVKKPKAYNLNEEADILVSGIISSREGISPEERAGVSGMQYGNEVDNGDDHAKLLGEIWSLDQWPIPSMSLKDEETYFYSKLLETLKIYQRTMPTVLEGAFDFFKVLPNNPMTLPVILQQSFLSLLIEHIGWSPNCKIPVRMQPLMYKHLNQFINLMIYSPSKDIKDQAHILAHAAMLSTGAFDGNPREISIWFLFLPGFSGSNSFVEHKELEIFQKLSSSVVSFLCDAVSTTGNNLFKYWDILRGHIGRLKGPKGLCPDFSPLVICVLEKCLRLLSSDSGILNLSEKTMVSLYVCNTLRYLLQTQVEAGLLSSLIARLLSKRLEDGCGVVNVSGDFCEWRPLKNLLFFSNSIKAQKVFSISSDGEVVRSHGSFANNLDEVKRIIRNGCDDELVGLATAFSLSMLCTTPIEILQHFPLVISISKNELAVPFSLFLYIFFLEPSLLNDVSKLWPEMFFTGLESFSAMTYGEERNEGKIYASDDSVESASVAFCFFLKQAPFYVLFPAILSIDNSHFLDHLKLQNVLLTKLSEGTAGHFISYFRYLLFWMHQVHSYYRINPSDELEKLSEMCTIFIESMLAQLFVGKPDTACSNDARAPLPGHYVQEVVEIIFRHPAVMASLECPLYNSLELTDAVFGENLETFISLARQGFHGMDHHVLSVIRTLLEHLLVFCSSEKTRCEVDCDIKQILMVVKALIQKLFLIFRNNFDRCIETKELVHLIPTLYALHNLIRFISPFELLELAQGLFSIIDINDSALLKSFQSSALIIGLHIAGCAFDSLSSYVQHPYIEQRPFALIWSMEEKSFDVSLFERVYFQVSKIATCSELDAADICLLKAVNVANARKVILEQFLPSCMVISRVIANSPINVLSHCIHKISRAKAKLLFLLTNVSPVHLSIFGHLFSDVINKSSLTKGSLMRKTCNYSLSDEDAVLLLPVALSYLNSISMKFRGQFFLHFRYIPHFYWRVLLRGFSNWRSYVSRDMFEVELGGLLPSSMEELLDVANGSLLGKAIHMLRQYFSLCGDSVKLNKRLKLFNSSFPHSGTHDDLLGCDIGQIDAYEVKQSLNFINMIVVKILLCKMLLFPEDKQVQPLLEDEVSGKIDCFEVGSNEEGLLRSRFLNMLVHTWKLIVEKFPSNTSYSTKSEGTKFSLYRLLEVFILRNIAELTAGMHCFLITFHSLPFMEQLARSSLHHRFDDPETLKVLRNIVASLLDGKFSCILFLQLLLAHSQFAPTIQAASKLSGCSQFGLIFKPMSSIMRLLVTSCTDQMVLDRKNNLQTSELCMKQLEVLKLLRILFRILGQQGGFDSNKEIGINSRELLFLLQASYGATLHDIDLEIYSLMQEIEFTDKSTSGTLAEMDYLWGSAAVKIRKEREKEQDVSSENGNDIQARKECRKFQFREILSVDPRMCANAVLYFPYNRTVGEGSLSFNGLQSDYSGQMLEGHPTGIERIHIYDPVFILRFSIYSLLMGYIEPLEFASLGLLAVTFVSISSLDDGMRKLGYESLGRFKTALEKCQKKRDVMRLRLLLTYLQNGINEPWQKIPSITAIFVAEASFVLLDPSHDHYSTISKHLMRCPSVNLKGIPLFHNFFQSSSVNFKTERSWMLRLLFAGLNLDDDAQIYIRNSIFEFLLSFYSSPLSDDESKELILQMVKKSVKMHKMARYLAEHCSLISWLSSIISFFGGRQYQDQKSFAVTQLNVALEVVSDIISSRNTSKWLQEYALEQLSELSFNLHKIFVSDIKLTTEKVSLVNSILQILATTLKISQKRKVYQPHFTLSMDGLFELCERVNICNSGSYGTSAMFALRTVLMSTPPVTIFCVDREKLLKFIKWAISTALQWSSMKDQPKEPCHHLSVVSKGGPSEDSLLSKLLRWLTASVILGMLSWGSQDLEMHHSVDRSNLETLQSLLEHNEKGCQRNHSGFGCADILAATIFYLQRLVEPVCRMLPSVVSALSLLCFSHRSPEESDFLLGLGIPLESICSRICCPAEANPSWRWSFYQPWKDLSSELSDAELLDEAHACQTLLVVISNVLGLNSLYSKFLSHHDVDSSGVFKWERSIIESK